MRRRSSATCSSASAHRRAPPRAGLLPSSRVGRCSALARERHALSRHSAFAQVLRALTRPLAPTRYRPRWERARTGAALQAHAHVYTRPRTFCSSFAGGSARLDCALDPAPLRSMGHLAMHALGSLEPERFPGFVLLWRLSVGRGVWPSGSCSVQGPRGANVVSLRLRSEHDVVSTAHFTGCAYRMTVMRQQ